jgi:hypothetical protein
VPDQPRCPVLERRLLVCAALVLIVGLASPAVAAGRPAPQRQVAVPSNRQLVVRPKTLSLLGNVLNGTATDLVWSRWGSNKAVARGLRKSCPTGTDVEKLCRTDPTTVTLSDPVGTTEGWLYYEVSYQDKGGRKSLPKSCGPLLPSALVVLPTAGNVTANYLWEGKIAGSPETLYSLQLVQNGEAVSGSIEMDRAHLVQATSPVSGIATAGTVSLNIADASVADQLGIATLAMKFAHGDLSWGPRHRGRSATLTAPARSRGSRAPQRRYAWRSTVPATPYTGRSPRALPGSLRPSFSLTARSAARQCMRALGATRRSAWLLQACARQWRRM